ncbi:MAG TPA: hypothetical protein VHV10_05360 [Ktedonobacteraceae bacterium]|nr:hypothetical protein [Ktedonobacteraceae bacterium]
MKCFIFYIQKIPFFSLLGLTLVVTACSQLTAPNAFSTPSHQNADYATFTYENVDFKIVSVAQQSSFDDDSTTGAAFIVRIGVKERNEADTGVYIPYSDAFLLILPDGDTISASAEETPGTIDQNIVTDNWVDFPLNDQQDLNKLVLRVGVANEHQMDIPLTNNLDVSKYQSKTIMSEDKFQYGGVDWTITKVTASLSANGQQADARMRYIAVELSAYNAGPDAFYPQPDNNIRLKSQDTLQSPAVSTLPLAIVAAPKGTTGIVYFLMPENDTQLTLDFLAQPYSHIPEVSASFQVPV